MGARRRWTATALLLVAAQAVVMLWLDLALGLNGIVREALVNGASILADVLAALLPPVLGSSLGVITTFLGFGWFLQHLVLPAFSGSPRAGISTLGGALVAPVYLAVRRVFLNPKDGEDARVPVSLRERMAKALEAIRPASTSVQEPL